MRPHIDPLDIITISTVILGLTGFTSWRVFRPEKRFRVPSEIFGDVPFVPEGARGGRIQSGGGIGANAARAQTHKLSHNNPVSDSGSVGSL